MKIPLKYNMRSLWVRKTGTLMTVLGIGLTVAVVIVMAALVMGLTSAFVESGHDNQFIVLRKGSLNEVNSYFGRNALQDVKFLPGIARDDQGEPLVSGELVVVINWPRMDGESTNLIMRGLGGTGLKLRPEVGIVEGRLFREGLREIIVSRPTSRRFQGMQLGNTVEINEAPWKVVGIFDAGGTAYDSEIFAAYDDIAQEWRRPIFTSMLLRTEDSEKAAQLRQRVDDDERIQLQATPQREYFAEQTTTAGPVMALGMFVSIMMGVGACFAAMNMMYGTILSRVKEIATLRALGFGRFSILSSFLVEAIILTLAGGLVGCLLALPFNGLTTGTTNFAGSFSEVLFRFTITPFTLASGMAFALTMGILGGFLPSLRASRIRLIDALRD